MDSSNLKEISCDKEKVWSDKNDAFCLTVMR